ncbi:MAG TPA: serine hydrolase domain-containing protein [Rhodothermales bacterium]|nr:serine hydrolase domain-containing protein [Rhodothermales bacterium]
MTARCCFLFALLVAARPAAAQPLPDDSLRLVDAVFARFSADGPGCAVGVTRGGAPALARAYGLADLEHDVPNTPATIFEAGSVSKQFTAAAAILLALDGKLSLDADVRTYVPELPDYGTPITVRHLIHHTSGLRDWGVVAALEGWPRGARVHTHAHVLDIARRQRMLNYQPGDFYSYTNTGYNLLAIIVERVSGQSFAAFTRDRLFAPLGMTSTRWRDDFSEVVKGRAVAYRPGPNGTFRLDMPFENVHGNGGLLTTVADLLHWTDALQTERGLPAALVAEMHRQARLNSGRPIEYAGGLVVSRYGAAAEVSHSGATAGYRAFLARYPARHLAVAVLCNAASADATMLARRVADLFLGAPPASTAPTPFAMPAEALAARAGLYRNTRTLQPLRLASADGQLRLEGGPVLVPRSDAQFQAGAGTSLAFEGPGHTPFRMAGADGDTVLFEPQPAFAPSAGDLAGFAGTYRSDEAEATFAVAVEDGRLVLRDRYGATRPLRPVYPDAFVGEGGTYRFVRDASGNVTELSVMAGRVWDLRFRRL